MRAATRWVRHGALRRPAILDRRPADAIGCAGGSGAFPANHVPPGGILGRGVGCGVSCRRIDCITIRSWMAAAPGRQGRRDGAGFACHGLCRCACLHGRGDGCRVAIVHPPQHGPERRGRRQRGPPPCRRRQGGRGRWARGGEGWCSLGRHARVTAIAGPHGGGRMDVADYRLPPAQAVRHRHFLPVPMCRDNRLYRHENGLPARGMASRAVARFLPSAPHHPPAPPASIQ